MSDFETVFLFAFGFCLLVYVLGVMSLMIHDLYEWVDAWLAGRRKT